MTNMQSYVSARGRATALVVLVIVQLALTALATLAFIGSSALLDDNQSVGKALSGIGYVFTSLDRLVYLAAIVVFLTWVYRSIANLPAIGSMSSRFSPSEAVWVYFIPFLNFVLGYQVMATIWAESQPAVVDENGFSPRRKKPLVNAWWALVLVTMFVPLIQRFASKVDEGLRVQANGQVVVGLFEMLTGVLFLVMIHSAQRRQDEQWLDLERRRAVPQPNADALR